MEAKNSPLMWHQEAITAGQQDVLRQLAPFTQVSGMYLGGGTAVAIHLGHRRSIDFDWFTERSILDPMLLAQHVREAGIAFQTESVERGTLHGNIEGVRMSFLEYRYPLLRPVDTWNEFNCAIASIDDLAAMKLLAVAQRGSKKDFVDVYAIGAEKLSLPKMLDCYRLKYSVDDVARLLCSLSYFDDADREPTPEMLSTIPWDAMKRAIKRWVKDLAG